MTIVTRMDYCQFLIGAQINYTCTYFADHKEFLSHDAVRRYLQSDKMAQPLDGPSKGHLRAARPRRATFTGRMIWDQVKSQVIPSPKGYLLFDDTVADHNFSCDIEPVYKQWSGNVKHVMAQPLDGP